MPLDPDHLFSPPPRPRPFHRPPTVHPVYLAWPSTVSIVCSANGDTRWMGFRGPDNLMPKEFDPRKHEIVGEPKYTIGGECVLFWTNKEEMDIESLLFDEMMMSQPFLPPPDILPPAVSGDQYLTSWDATLTLEPEPDTLPEVVIVIKYVKHSKTKSGRLRCQKCDTTELYWAHEIPEGVITDGTEEDYCSRCKSTGSLVLIDAEKSPTGKWKLHQCAPTETQVAAGGDGDEEDGSDSLPDGIPDEHAGAVPDPNNVADQEDPLPPASSHPDPVGSGTTGNPLEDPWLNTPAPSECGADPEGNHHLDASGTCMNCGEDVRPFTPPPPSPGSSGDEDHPDYVTHPEMDTAFKNFKDVEWGNITTVLESTKQYIDTAIEGIEIGVRPVEVSVSYDGAPAKPLPGLHHYALPDTILMLTARLHVLMVGEKGVGKGKIARQAADALQLPFYSLPGSLSPQTPVSSLIGYMNSAGNYTGTLFRQAFEHGGVIFLDELDNAHPACMAAANDALAISPGETLAFPDGMVAKHPDFVCVAAANTFGRGPDQQYAARQRGDAATWDRFCVLTVGIDEPLEMTLCNRTGASANVVSEVLRFVRTIRRECLSKGMPLLHGPRACIDMCKMIKVGLSVEQAIDSRVRRGMSDQDWEKLTSEVRDIEL